MPYLGRCQWNSRESPCRIYGLRGPVRGLRGQKVSGEHLRVWFCRWVPEISHFCCSRLLAGSLLGSSKMLLSCWAAGHDFRGKCSVSLHSPARVCRSPASPGGRAGCVFSLPGTSINNWLRSICCFGKQLFLKCLCRARRKKKSLLFRSSFTEHIYSSKSFYLVVKLLAARQKTASVVLQKSVPTIYLYICILFYFSCLFIRIYSVWFFHQRPRCFLMISCYDPLQ